MRDSLLTPKILARSYRVSSFVILIVSLLFTTAFSMELGKNTGYSESYDAILSTPTSPMTVNLSLSEIPKLNQSVELICVISTIIDAPNTTAQIILPDGLELVRGDILWEGNIGAGGQKTLNATIKPIKLGNFAIESDAISVQSEDSWFGGRDYIFISVYSDIGVQSEMLFFDESQVRSDECLQLSNSSEFLLESPVESDEISPEPAKLECGVSDDNLSVKSLGTIVVKGRWVYRDRAGMDQPNKWATVWIYDDDVLTNDDYLGSTLINSDGTFETDPIDNSDGEGGKQDIYVRVLASSSVCSIRDSNNEIYDGYTTTTWNDVPDGTLDIGSWRVPEADGERPAWWVYSDVIKGWNYLRNQVIPTYAMPQIIVRWEYGHSANYDNCLLGTHCHVPGSEEIHLDGRPTIGHANDPDVIIHEYGHNAMYSAYGNWFPQTYCPSPHTWFMDEHVNCAWTEGWANFFPLAVFNDKYYTDTTQLVQIDFETPSSIYDSYTGDDVEGRVAAALYDIFDSSNDGYDTFSDGFNNLWDTFYYLNHNNFAEFYGGWKSRNHDIPKCNAAIFQNTIDYNNPPTCTITSPNGGGWYSGTIPVSSSTSDTDGSISSVEFQYSRDGSNWNGIGIDSSSSGGWSVSWDTTIIQYDSSVWVRSRAKDNLGKYSSWDNSDSSFGVENGACYGTDTSCGIYPNCENCNAKDGCYAYGDGCEERNYYCQDNAAGCKYSSSKRNTDFYDAYVNYCSGDTIRKHRLYHNFYCDGGLCKDHTTWADDQLVENCNNYDGWADTGNTRWIDDPNNPALEKQQKEQAYRDYTCSGTSCTYSVTSTRWVDTGVTREKASGWSGLGGWVTSFPNMIVDNQGRTHIFVRAGDNALWDNVNGVWYRLGGSLASAPFPVKDKNGRIHVLVRGSDNALWDLRFDTGAWTTGWYGFGGSIAEMPTATQYGGTGKIIIMVRATDNALWAFDLWDPVTMKGTWIGLGGSIRGIPFALEDTSGNIHSFVQGTDNALWDHIINAQGYRGWYGLGGILSTGQIMPTAVNEPGYPGYLAVMVRGADDRLWMCDLWPDKSPHWIPLGGWIASGGYAITDTSARIHTFVKGADGAVWENVFSSSPWSPSTAKWQLQGGSLYPMAWHPVAFANGYTYMAVIGSDSALWKKVYPTISPSTSSSEEDERITIEVEPTSYWNLSISGDLPGETTMAVEIPVEIIPVEDEAVTTMMSEGIAEISALEERDVSSTVI